MWSRGSKGRGEWSGKVKIPSMESIGNSRKKLSMEKEEWKKEKFKEIYKSSKIIQTCFQGTVSINDMVP